MRLTNNVVSQSKKLKVSITFAALTIVLISNALDFWFSGRAGFGYPIYSYMTSPVGRFDDFYNNLYTNADLKNFYTVQKFVFWPVGILFYQVFSIFPVGFGLALFQILSILIFATVLHRFSGCKVTTVALLMSFPVLFCLARGNNELILSAVVMFAISKRSDFGTNKVSASLFVLANLFEASPFGFFLWNNPVRTFLRVSWQFIFLNAVFLFGFIRFQNMWEYVDGLVNGARYASGGIDFSFVHHHSLMSAIGIGNLYLFDTSLSSSSVRFLSSLILFVGVFIMILALKFRIYDEIDRLLLVFVSWSIFPAVSADYKMVYLLFPLSLLLGLNHRNSLQKIQLWFLVLAVIPKHFIWVNSPSNPVGGSIGGFLNPLLLFAVFLITLSKGKPQQNKSLTKEISVN